MKLEEVNRKETFVKCNTHPKIPWQQTPMEHGRHARRQ